MAIEDLCEKVTSGATPLRSKVEFYDGGTISWFKTGELRDGWLDRADECITPLAIEQTSTKIFPANTVLMAMYGDGKTITSLGILRTAAASNQACCAMMADAQRCDFRFLFYALKHHREDFIRLASGGAQRNLSGALIRRFGLNTPTLEEQRAIAHILGTLDDKIELNRRMNETLEAMARALFKSWFVDFDPVRAKAAGRQPSGMDAETAKLFPSEFEMSELGEVPRGWRVVPIGTIADVQHGYAFKGHFFNDERVGDILLTPGNFAIGGGFKQDKLKYYNGPVPPETVLRERELLVTMTDLSKNSDTLGYPLLVPATSDGKRFLHNQRLGRVVPRPEERVDVYFLFFTFCLQNYRNEIVGGASGTTVKHTSPRRIQAYKTAIPNREVSEAFSRLVAQFVNKQAALFSESRIHSALRDTLLPKLLSGEVCLGKTVQQTDCK
ncbi:MAG: restriction endonuclease subunit S [Myxococcota bacterium]|jgi:type I restriction enzyme S subunit|nr:restriction endonuclease subunit S [Myxococcota bacterium]